MCSNVLEVLEALQTGPSLKRFQADFFSIDPAESAALALHNREQYRQGKRMLDDYINCFWALVKQVAYPDGLQLCLMFQDGMHSALIECINNLVEGCPDNEQIAS
ncbi:hypothetical protein C0993_008692 [Termitomyces sp. T159_Od127]|nr:hypothetical protein C0993_008692 [Termitomyces sp. T159_Od127]